MDIITILERSTQAECREIGELFLSLADTPRGPGWEASMVAVRERFTSPADRDLVEAIKAGNERVSRHDKAMTEDEVGRRNLEVLVNGSNKQGRSTTRAAKVFDS